jgi:PKD repeat protein
VLTPTQVSLGSLSSGWSIASNLNTPGLIRVALAGANPIATDGELLKLVFTASSQAGLETNLNLIKGLLNEGNLTSALVSGHVKIAAPVQAGFSATPVSGPAPLNVVFANLSSGDFTSSLWSFGDGSTSSANAPTHSYTAVGTYTVTLTISGPGGSQSLVRSNYINAYGLKVSGQAQYWSGGAGLGGVGINLNGANSYSSSTNSTGVYTISNVLAGNYTLVPGKQDNANGISAYDASLVLQHIAGLSILTGYPANAADVNNSGSIGSMDASNILQKAVGLIDVPFPGAGTVWEFDPPNRSYVNLNTDRSSQGFVGILLGDPSGSWLPCGTQSINSGLLPQAMLSVQSGQPDPTGKVVATIFLDTAGAQVTSLDLKLSYDPNKAQSISADAGPMLNGWLIAKNEPVAGEIWIGLANSQPVSGAGIVLTLVFQMNALGGFSQLHFIEGFLNEGSIPAMLIDGRIGGINLFLPIARS